MAEDGIVSTVPAVEIPAAAVVPAAPAEDGDPAQKPADKAPAEGDKPDAATDEQPDKDDKPTKGMRRLERKLGRLHREAAEQKARADFLERQLSESRPKATADSGEPKIEQFNDVEEYATAKAKYAAEKAVREHVTSISKAAQQQTAQNLSARWEKQMAKAEEKYDDWETVVGDVDLKPDQPWSYAVMEAENGIDILHWLGSNPKETERILRLPPASQIREIGKLEAKLAAESPKPKTPSKAPAPINPVGGRSAGTSEMPSDSDDINTWMRKENARMKKAAA